MAEPEVILYDVKSALENPKCSSPNTWKTRALLNFKGIPYKTEWVELCDMEERFEPFGLKANKVPEEGIAKYTCPIVRTKEGKYIMESTAIAKELERLYPEPTLNVESEDTKRAVDATNACMMALVPPYMVRIPKYMLPPRSQVYFHRERSKLFGGMALEDLAKHPEMGGEKAWEKAEASQRVMLEMLSENGEGPFVRGKDVNYADLVLVAWWRFLSKIDEGGDLYGRVVGYSSKFGELERACQDWFERDDY